MSWYICFARCGESYILISTRIVGIHQGSAGMAESVAATPRSSGAASSTVGSKQERKASGSTVKHTIHGISASPAPQKVSCALMHLSI